MTPLNLRITFSVALSAILTVTLGCGGGQTTAPVSGTVSFEGTPVPEGTVTFYPASGGRPAIGQIQSDGTYVLSTITPGDGVPPGEYTVAIEARRVQAGGPVPKSLQEEIEGVGQGAAPPKIEWLVPREYSSAESSGLTATVESGENKIDFQLP